MHLSVGLDDGIEILCLLQNLLDDLRSGLVGDLSNKARAEVFDEFLDHADHYVADGRKNEAGVIAGAVFEDTVRRMCRTIDIIEKDRALDQLISALAKKDSFSSVQAKRARAAAAVRNKALHAQWDEFTMKDVEATVTFARELTSSISAGHV